MLKVFSIEDCVEWDKVVNSFKDFDVYYLSGYVRTFQIHGDGEPLLFYYEDDHCRGINVVMKRDISNDPYLHNKIEPLTFFDFATPYGYGGWLIEGEQTNNLFSEYEKWCCENKIISEFVRFHPVINNYLFSKDAYEVVPLGQTVSVDITDKENIWNNFTPKNRNVIRKAINNEIEIEYAFSKEIFDIFISIYNSTMVRDNALPYYFFKKEFYESIFEKLKDNALIFYAKYKGVIIAASIIIYANKKLNYHLSGSLGEYKHLAPTNLLLWKAAEWGNEKNFTSFHLGGGVGSSEDGLFKFKKSFYRGELCRFHIGKKIFNIPIYKKLVSLSKNANYDYFPHKTI